MFNEAELPDTVETRLAESEQVKAQEQGTAVRDKKLGRKPLRVDLLRVRIEYKKARLYAHIRLSVLI